LPIEPLRGLTVSNSISIAPIESTIARAALDMRTTAIASAAPDVSAHFGPHPELRQFD